MQIVPATASLGPAYATTPTIGYRILALDGSVATAYTTANVVSLGGGFYRVTGGVSASDAGGIIQWWSNNPNNGGVLLAVASVEPVPGAVAEEAVATAVWTYTGGDRSLTGPQSAQLTQILEQLKADYFKGNSRFIRYRQGTLEIILDKDVTFNPDTGYTITEHQ